MNRIYSYIIPVDDGAAPNPYGGICNLTICKPAIRRKADKAMWVIGTGSKNTKLADGLVYNFSKSLVYAMKVTDKKTLQEYDEHCQNNLPIKIPKLNSRKFEEQVGDCIYDYSKGLPPIQRGEVHGPDNINTDLGGKNALLSDHFYYFGSKPVLLPEELHHIIHKTQNCKLIKDANTFSLFEKWISQFKLNHIYADPQQRFRFTNSSIDECKSDCAGKRLKNNQGKNDSIC